MLLCHSMSSHLYLCIRAIEFHVRTPGSHHFGAMPRSLRSRESSSPWLPKPLTRSSASRTSDREHTPPWPPKGYTSRGNYAMFLCPESSRLSVNNRPSGRKTGDLSASRKKARSKMHAGIHPRSVPFGVPTTDGIEHPPQQVPQSNLGDQTCLNTFGLPSGDQGAITHVPTSPTDPVYPIRADLDCAHSPCHTSSISNHSSPSSNKMPRALPALLNTRTDERSGPFTRPVSAPLSPKREQNIGDSHDYVRLRVVQTPQPRSIGEAHFRRAGSPISVNPLATGTGTEFCFSALFLVNFDFCVPQC